MARDDPPACPSYSGWPDPAEAALRSIPVQRCGARSSPSGGHRYSWLFRTARGRMHIGIAHLTRPEVVVGQRERQRDGPDRAEHQCQDIESKGQRAVLGWPVEAAGAQCPVSRPRPGCPCRRSSGSAGHRWTPSVIREGLRTRAVTTRAQAEALGAGRDNCVAVSQASRSKRRECRLNRCAQIAMRLGQG